MKKHSKRYREAVSLVDRSKPVSITEGLETLKKLRGPKFQESVEVAMSLGIDVKQSDQQVRGSVGLPHGLGKSVRIIVFADGPDVQLCKEAGAVEAGGDDLVKKVMDGWQEFDVVISHRSMMPKIGKLGRVLGPRGLMPSPKTGTVTDNVMSVLKEYLAGKVEFRADDAGNVHAAVGKIGFDLASLKENVETFIHHIQSIKPPSSKGIFIRNITLSSTMSPGIPVVLAVEER